MICKKKINLQRNKNKYIIAATRENPRAATKTRHSQK